MNVELLYLNICNIYITFLIRVKVIMESSLKLLIIFFICITLYIFWEYREPISENSEKPFHKGDLNPKLDAWPYPNIIEDGWVELTELGCVIWPYPVDCVRIWNFEFKKLAIAFSCPKSWFRRDPISIFVRDWVSDLRYLVRECL